MLSEEKGKRALSIAWEITSMLAVVSDIGMGLRRSSSFGVDDE